MNKICTLIALTSIFIANGYSQQVAQPAVQNTPSTAAAQTPAANAPTMAPTPVSAEKVAADKDAAVKAQADATNASQVAADKDAEARKAADAKAAADKVAAEKKADAQAAADKEAAENDPKVQLTEETYLKDYAATDGDRLINAKLRDKITGGTFDPKYGNIVIYSVYGDVTLSGVLTKFESIKEIEALAKAIPGVKKVKNNMFAPATVTPEPKGVTNAVPPKQSK